LPDCSNGGKKTKSDNRESFPKRPRLHLQPSRIAGSECMHSEGPRSVSFGRIIAYCPPNGMEMSRGASFAPSAPFPC
jgi:hypothetical protein